MECLAARFHTERSARKLERNTLSSTFCALCAAPKLCPENLSVQTSAARACRAFFKQANALAKIRLIAAARLKGPKLRNVKEVSKVFCF